MKKIIVILFFMLILTDLAFGDEVPSGMRSTPGNRVASVYISQDFINEQLIAHSKNAVFLQKLSVDLDPTNGQIFLKGILQIPVEELRAINFDPRMGRFKFQVTILPRTTKHGHLILEFPLDQTFFYPEHSKFPKRDRVIIPVQMLSLGLASARGYLAALSGDFSSFDRKREKVEALVNALARSIKGEKNEDARDELKTEQETLKLQLQAMPLERKQLQAISKQITALLGFTGEKEIKLNEELAARDNALILKIKLAQLTPYLEGVDLGGVRVVHDKKDGDGGQDYLVVDINSKLTLENPPPVLRKPSNRTGMKIAPLMVVRLNQSLLASQAVVAAEKKSMSSKLKDFAMNLREDGLHVSGQWSTWLTDVPFDTIVDFETTEPDVFEVRVRDVKVFGIDFDFLSKFVLESLQARLEKSLQGICSFRYLGEVKDGSRALQVTVEPEKLVPAVTDAHLVDVDVREGEFLLKIGHI